ncbi:MAG: hypothetical protein Q8O99_06885 [bacterium]|nr:hypothetical protein [bacterium]
MVEETVVKGVKHFFVPDKKVLQHLLEKQRKQLSQREDVMSLVESELAQYDTEYRSPIPKIQLFQGREGIQAAFDDLYHYCSDQGYRILKCFASNTLESQTASKYTFQDIEKDFLERLEKQQIALQSYIGNGIMMLEYVTKSTSAKDLLDLPAGHSSVYLFLT